MAGGPAETDGAVDGAGDQVTLQPALGPLARPAPGLGGPLAPLGTVSIGRNKINLYCHCEKGMIV